MPNMSQEEFMRHYKNIRQAAFEESVKQSKAREAEKARITAEMNYMAMMSGIDLSQDDDDEEEEITNGTENTTQ